MRDKMADYSMIIKIRDMVVLFPGSPLSMIGIASAMEIAKLVTAGWLARR
jgi:hypothetical protein